MTQAASAPMKAPGWPIQTAVLDAMTEKNLRMVGLQRAAEREVPLTAVLPRPPAVISLWDARLRGGAGGAGRRGRAPRRGVGQGLRRSAGRAANRRAR